MKVKRSDTLKSFEMNWCPICAKVVDMEPRITGLPGIASKRCPECDSHWQANYLEDPNDLLEVDDNFIFPEELEVL